MRGTGGITKTPAVKPLSIELLGTPRVSLEGRGLRFGRKKSLALLCYLAVEGGEHRRSELAELLWPRSDGRRARADLRSTLAGLRKALVEDAVRGRNGSEGVRPLTIDGELLGIDPRGF